MHAYNKCLSVFCVRKFKAPKFDCVLPLLTVCLSLSLFLSLFAYGLVDKIHTKPISILCFLKVFGGGVLVFQKLEGFGVLSSCVLLLIWFTFLDEGHAPTL